MAIFIKINFLLVSDFNDFEKNFWKNQHNKPVSNLYVYLISLFKNMPAFLRTYGVFQLQDCQEIRYHIETLSSLPVEFIAVFFGKSWSIRLSLFICSKRILANPAVTFYPFCTLPAKLPETCSCIKTGHFTIGVFRGRMVVVLHNYHPAKGLAPSGLPECSALRFSHSKGKRHERQKK